MMCVGDYEIKLSIYKKLIEKKKKKIAHANGMLENGLM